MLSAFTSQTQGSPYRWKQKLALCLLLVSAFVYRFTQHQASRRPAFVIPAVGVAMDSLEGTIQPLALPCASVPRPGVGKSGQHVSPSS